MGVARIRKVEDLSGEQRMPGVYQARLFQVACAALLALALSALPAVLLLWRRQVPRRRRARGLCPACGYDLRASPGPCPECGAPAGATSA